MNGNICLVIVLIGITLTIVSSFPLQEQMNEGPPLPINQEVVGNGQQMSPAENRAMRLYLLSWLQNLGGPLSNERIKAKRTCLLNAGLSHSCDYKDTLAAIDEGYFLGSDQTPGKK